jgi:hypothetical protein
MSRTKAAAHSLALTVPAETVRRASVEQFEDDLVASAKRLASCEGDDCVSAKHVEHAGRFLRAPHRESGANLFALGTVLAGTGLGAALSPLVMRPQLVVAMGVALLAVGAVLMVAFRFGRPRAR